MFKIIKFVFLTLTFSTQISSVFSMHTSPARSGIISSLYGLVLGNKDADTKYVQMVYKALKRLGVEDSTSVVVKEMNAVGPMLALQNGLASFTAWGGIWLNQEYLNSLKEHDFGFLIEFLIQKETANLVKNNHQKMVAVSVVSLLLIAAELYLLKIGLSSTHPMLKIVVLTLAGVLSVLAWYKYLLPYLVKDQEKQADLMAAKALIDNGEARIVDAYIKTLKESEDSDDGGLWWYSDREITKYLEDLKKVLAEIKLKNAQ